MNTTEIAAEMLECLTEERIGKFLGIDGDDMRIQFANVLEAAHWIGNYITENGAGAAFDGTPVDFAEPVIVRANILAYAELAGI